MKGAAPPGASPAIGSREARLRHGFAELERLGIVPRETSVADLEQALETRPDTALAVVDLLGGIAAEESGELLARIGDRAGDDKTLRREVRRSQYRLRQRGISLPEPTEAEREEPAPSRARAGGPVAEGYLSISDPLGDRLLWLLKPRSGGGLLHLSVIVNEPAGLKEAILAEVKRKSLRELRRELEARHGLRLVEVDWHYVDGIVGEGYARARETGSMPESVTHYPQLRLQLFTTPAETPPLSPLGEPPAEDAASLASSAALFEVDELRAWFLPQAVLAPYLARYREIRESPIVLERPLQLQRIAEIIADAVQEIFSADRARSWQRRLAEAAHYFHETARPEPAARARAVAAAIDATSGGKGVPFCEELVRRSFGLFFAGEAERERQEKASSVLVTPDDLRAEQARARKSRGPARS